jgi:hypothetical protein
MALQPVVEGEHPFEYNLASYPEMPPVEGRCNVPQGRFLVSLRQG